MHVMLAETQLLPLRPMTVADLPDILPLEQQVYAFPWTEGIFKDCLRHHYPGWLHEQDGRLAGYAVIMLSLDEMHLLNLCIHPDHQGQRLGSRLLATLERIGRTSGAETCFLEVRQSNFAAIRLYLNAGFNEIGVRKAYYPARHGREDALIMAKTLC